LVGVSVVGEQMTFFPDDLHQRGHLQSPDASELAHPLGVALTVALTLISWAFIAWLISILI
jgi:hypothetical protein